MRQFRIGRLNGRYTVAWTLDDGRRRRFRLDARTRKEAEAEALDVIQRQTAQASGQSVSALWPLYLMEREGRTIVRSMSSSAKPLLTHFGALRPDQITTDHCRSYARQRAVKGLAQGSIWTELGHLRIVTNWAAKKGLIPKAPHIELPPKPAPKDRHLTRKEAARLLSVDMQPHVRVAIVLMLTTGARASAALELTWDRVDLTRRRLDLRLDGAGPRKGRAVVPINDTLLAILTEARAAALSDHVIEWAQKPVKSIRNGFSRAVERAKLDDVGMHTLRHTAAVWMVEAGHSMDEVAQFLGHSNPSVTFKVYGRFSPGHLRKAASALELGDGSTGAARFAEPEST